MQLNSFCVIVTGKENEVLFWGRPTDLDSARILFRQKCWEFKYKEPKVPILEGEESPIQLAEQMQLEPWVPTDDYTNKKIEEHIKMWKGDLRVPMMWIPDIAYSVQQGRNYGGNLIRLLHSSKT